MTHYENTIKLGPVYTFTVHVKSPTTMHTDELNDDDSFLNLYFASVFSLVLRVLQSIFLALQMKW